MHLLECFGEQAEEGEGESFNGDLLCHVVSPLRKDRGRESYLMQ